MGRRFGADDSVGLRLNAVRRDGDTGVAREHREPGLLTLGVDYAGRDVRLSADVGHQDHKLNGARPSVTVAADVALPAAHGNWAQAWTRSNERDTFGTARGEIDLAREVVAWAAFGARAGEESNVLAAPSVSAPNGAAGMYRVDSARTGESGVRGKLRTGAVGHSLSASASAYRQQSRNAYAFSDFGGFASNIHAPVDVAAPAADFFAAGKLNNLPPTAKTVLSSYAVADTLAFARDTILLTPGARHQHIQADSYDYDSGAALSRYSESKNTPMAGLVYKPARGVSLYANYIEGLQQGPVASGTNIDNIGQAFAPYVSRQKEIGVKYDGGAFGASAALFRTTPPSASVRERHFGVFGEQRNQGLELTVFGAPARGLRALGGLTLLDATQRVSADGLKQGKDAIGVPRAQMNIGVAWDVPGARGLTPTARGLCTGAQFADGANRQELPSWSRLDLGASRRPVAPAARHRHTAT
ncbi:MAG TPA: hypothetical protein DCW29_15320 [Janthinobacterium sp.]|nr:hypothetical protein [Janthinobacterium sp.]